MAARFPRTTRLLVAAALATAGLPAAAGAAGRGAIETPSYNSSQTGIALISGWNCSGRKIQLRIDDGPPQTAGRTPRARTPVPSAAAPTPASGC